MYLFNCLSIKIYLVKAFIWEIIKAHEGSLLALEYECFTADIRQTMHMPHVS